MPRLCNSCGDAAMPDEDYCSDCMERFYGPNQCTTCGDDCAMEDTHCETCRTADTLTTT